MEFSVLNHLVESVKPQSKGSSLTRSGANHVHTEGVVLVTFEEKTSRQQAKRDQGFDTAGYSAHIGVGKSHQGQRLDDSSVLKITEIQIHTQKRLKDIDEDTVSLDRKSGLTIESAPEGPPERDYTSASLSEIQFARSRP